MGDIALVINRTFNASPDVVFKAWTEPEQIAKWYGPEGISTTIHDMEVREGGEYRLTMKGKDGEYPLRGMFKTIEPPHKLVMTWQWEKSDSGEGMAPETLVTVEFRENDGKTDMVFKHEGFADESVKEHHNQGWSGSLDKLERTLAEG